MKWTKDALELIKKFAAGVSCPEWNEDTIENTMFHSYCADIARKAGKEEIDIEAVRRYILKGHNPVTCHLGIIAKESVESIENCMVRPKKVENGWVCVHGEEEVTIISGDEAEFLEMENKKLLKGLR